MDKTVWSVKFVNLITHLAVFTRSVLSCFCFSSLLKSSTKCLPVHLFHAALISMCSIGHKWLASNANIQNDCWLWKQIVIELTDQITGEAKVWLPSTSPEMWALNEEKEGASNFWRRSYLTHPTLIKIMKPCYLILPCIVSIHLLTKNIAKCSTDPDIECSWSTECCYSITSSYSNFSVINETTLLTSQIWLVWEHVVNCETES